MLRSIGPFSGNRAGSTRFDVCHKVIDRGGDVVTDRGDGSDTSKRDESRRDGILTQFKTRFFSVETSQLAHGVVSFHKFDPKLNSLHHLWRVRGDRMTGKCSRNCTENLQVLSHLHETNDLAVSSSINPKTICATSDKGCGLRRNTPIPYRPASASTSGDR